MLTFEGAVVSGVDQLGAFGAVGADLAGLTYVARVQYDVPGGPPAIPYAPLAVIGGPTLDLSEPMMSATLSIGGGAPVQLPVLDWNDGAGVLYVRGADGTLGEVQALAHGDEGAEIYFFAKGRNPCRNGEILHLDINTEETFGGRIRLPGMDADAAIVLRATAARATPVGRPLSLPEPRTWSSNDRGPGPRDRTSHRRAIA